MVLLAAAIFSKDGKALLSRQFVEMSRTRIEGLLTAFPKLIGTGKQHTFVETESVRYVYQPLEKLYVLLLTTKASNILEDLETLRLFAKVIPEYSRSLDEYDIKENIFELIFAFDEIVALGYRENVNLAQIRTFTEMDSHEEKAFLAVRESQEKEAKENMRRKVKELAAKHENVKGGTYRSGYSNTGFGSSSTSSGAYSVPIVPSIDTEKPVSFKPPPKSNVSSGKAMRLGGKAQVVDNFVDQLKAEGVAVEQHSEHRSRAISNSSGGGYQGSQASVVQENVHVKIEEKLRIEANHDTGVINMELLGTLMLRVANKDCNMVRLKLDLGDAIQMQTHPNVDKKLFQSSNTLQSKSAEKSFPVGQDINLLKWRLQTQEADQVPLLINCWPNKTASGCSVSIEYELQNLSLELHDVVVSIPLPHGAGAPVVKELSGEYGLDARKTHLLWTLPLVDQGTASGSMEFETKAGRVEDFFPVAVTFSAARTMTGLRVDEALDLDGNRASFSSETVFGTEKYEVV